MKKFQLKKLAMALIVIMFGFQALAQGRIDFATKGVSSQAAENATMNGFTASFSYNSMESKLVSTEKGEFSTIMMENTLPTGNIGEPQILVTRKLIAVPFGATPVVTVKNYTVNEYNLADYGIERLYPQQPSYSKSEKNPKFVYNEAAYTTRGYDERPLAEVTVMGTMRGIQVGALQLNSVRYNAAANTLRVYNDIEVEVTFENADLALTEQTLVNTYSPYFRTVYASLFNERAIRDIYDEHPDLWAVPVKVLVIANRMFEDAMQPWLQWKTEKGFYMDVNYTDEIGTTAAAIKQFIVGKYNDGLAAGQTPTWVVIVGDKNQVAASQTGSATQKVTDLYYYAVAGGSNDYFGDMFHSRFTCETVQEFQNAINKSLMYEQYTMPDPSYLDNVLLVAGWDSGWNPQVGKPTIQYAMNYYYNAEHGFANVYNFLQQPYNNPYASMNTGVNFVNYTAHGGETGWSDPAFSVGNANSLTNSGKPFLAMGNCCLAADWGYSSKCLGESLIIAPDKGAYAYIGSCPYTYWWEDYYFGVGATHTSSAMPTYEGSTMGVYDATFRDDFNSVSAIPFVGNVAVCYAHANGYQGSVSDQYYWECYHVLGDGTVCPYHTNPIENTVSHMPTLPIGMDTYEVTADPGSYVGISKDGVLLGAGEIGEEGTAEIPIEPVTSGGTAKIVVTHPQRQPYVMEVPCAALTGPYIAVDSFTPGNVPCNEEQTMSMSFKNVGADGTTGTTNVTLTCADENLTIIDGEGSFEALAANTTVTLTNEFSFIVATGVADGTKIQIDVTATCGTDVWTGKAKVTVGAPIIEFTNMQWAGAFVPGQTYTLVANFHNKGHYQATNAEVTATTTSNYLTINNATSTVGTVGVDGDAMAIFSITVAASCPTTEALPVEFTFTADNGVTATGSGTLKNTCNVVFDLVDSYGDGWNGNKLVVTTDYGFTQQLTIASGGSETYTLELNSGSHVTLTWIAGSYTYECSFTVTYEDGTVITTGSDLSSSYNFQFDVNCAGEPVTAEPVQNLAAAVEENTITLTWDAPAASNPVAYLIKRDGVQIDEVTELTYVDENLEWATTYTYYIFAVYEDGMSLPVAVSATTEEFVSVDENEMNVGIYPNPANSVLNIMTNAENYEYQMINSVGQVVMSGKASGNTVVNVSELNGMYFLRIIADGQTIVRKITVE
ncbi:MAG: T9SS type A sorting domain-containing protein [Bacteroidales bacterium]|nr:T9SS type A sorting domain-containing protein [Bacteroidales bacterium]